MISVARVHAGLGNLERAVAALEEAVALHTATSYRRGQGWARALIAHMHVRQGKTTLARGLLDQAIADLDAVGDLRGQAHAGLIAATLERATKRPDEARRRLDETESVAQRIGERRVIGLISLERAEIEEAAGHREAANQAAANAIEQLAAVGDPFNLLEVAAVWGRTTVDTGAGWQVRGFVEALRSALNLPAERSTWPAGAEDPAALDEGRRMDEFEVAALVAGAHPSADG